MKILLMATSSISVKIADRLIKRLQNDGHELRTYFTENASAIYSHYAAKSSPYEFNEEFKGYLWNGKIPHIDNVTWADVAVLCPADLNTIGKLANGIADNFITSSLAAWLGTGKPLFIAEAMNTNMFKNPFHLGNTKKLDKLPNVNFIQPTVKKLACGDFGYGALADIDTIANIVEGYNWTQPISNSMLIGKREYAGNDNLEEYRIVPLKHESFREYLPNFSDPGAFGAQRKFDIHEGVDIYCKYGSRVWAVEDGEVVDSYQYTGAAAGCGWWNDTWCIKVKGKSGVVTYGELIMPDHNIKYPEIGSQVRAGTTCIGYVGRVLRDNKLREDIRHHNTSMLHIELRKESHRDDGWKPDADRDKRLLDPTPYLKSKNLLPATFETEAR